MRVSQLILVFKMSFRQHQRISSADRCTVTTPIFGWSFHSVTRRHFNKAFFEPPIEDLSSDLKRPICLDGSSSSYDAIKNGGDVRTLDLRQKLPFKRRQHILFQHRPIFEAGFLFSRMACQVAISKLSKSARFFTRRAADNVPGGVFAPSNSSHNSERLGSCIGE